MGNTIQHARGIEQLVVGLDTQDGAGVRLTRLLTQDLQKRLDPFLMLDAFGSDNPGDYIAGFPNHPHRGFETITYMIAGRMRHKDSGGHEGLLQNGGVQWLTAGRGLTHSEMPEQEEGVMEGFQLWLNLPAKNKLCTPGYWDIQSEKIPEITTMDGVLVRIIAGNTHGTNGAMQREDTEPQIYDLHFPAASGAVFEQILPAAHNAFVYVYRGNLEVIQGDETTAVPIKRMAILTNEGDGFILRAQQNSRALVITGKPLNEPIAQHGPFVMNTREELSQAVDDFRAGLMG
jgi:redox-sensitive bicupin YhaK (pirin superfamily)